MAQGITRPIGFANLATIIIVVCISGWLTFDCKVGILLFPICKGIMEVSN